MSDSCRLNKHNGQRKKTKDGEKKIGLLVSNGNQQPEIYTDYIPSRSRFMHRFIFDQQNTEKIKFDLATRKKSGASLSLPFLNIGNDALLPVHPIMTKI